MIKNTWKFSPDGTHKWIIFLLVIVVQLSVIAFIGWRWHNISVDGIPYQWKCVPRLEVSSFGTDYVRVVFPEDTVQWTGSKVPEPGEIIYIQISRDEKGILQIEGASPDKPGVGSDYMKGTVVAYHDGSVQFQVGFDRYRIAPEQSDGIYDINSTDNVIASIRMKKGEGVIEGIFVNGIPLESSSNGAAMKAARDAANGSQETASKSTKPRIAESGMVPPKEE
ncbi:MAG: hypothetical protein LKF74_02450 [Megasphaera sp.]|jgi:hypothetical protein|nr:hypothetical protein [Megasphaera sp.]MCH4217406.1 hypothetical protein [Megasphaera sp.]